MQRYSVVNILYTIPSKCSVHNFLTDSHDALSQIYFLTFVCFNSQHTQLSPEKAPVTKAAPFKIYILYNILQIK